MPVSPNLIADAVVTAIRGLDLIPDAKVVRYKTPSLPPGVDPPAIVVVVGEAGAEGMTEMIDARTKLNRYPTLVVIITAAGGMLLADDATVRTWRDQIEDEIADKERTTFASVTGFNLVNTTGQAPFDGSVLNKDLNYSAHTFNVEVLETKAT
jgi:hypothetical protein